MPEVGPPTVHNHVLKEDGCSEATYKILTNTLVKPLDRRILDMFLLDCLHKAFFFRGAADSFTGSLAGFDLVNKFFSFSAARGGRTSRVLDDDKDALFDSLSSSSEVKSLGQKKKNTFFLMRLHSSNGLTYLLCLCNL